MIWSPLKWGGMVAVLAASIAVAVIFGYVFFGDVSSLEKTTIMARIQEETAIYYLDGQHRIGSIFEDYHRSYVSISEIPAHMQNAIIAAEDKNFYTHFGVDPTAIGHAIWEGVMAGFRFRRGGSTITQQTVKNIVGDWEATFARKFREMIRAIQLERLYSKQQILEFYLNQFHVAGNGNGISIAARYYFDKEVADLSLVEAAYIAGSVKSPSRYNPFIKRNKADYQRAIDAGFARKNYVLRRMLDHQWISGEEYRGARDRAVPFDKGSFVTSDVTLLTLIKKQLAHPEVLKALDLEHPNQLGTSGYKVYTTIDRDLQTSAQAVMRRNLAKLETILSGHEAEDPIQYKDLRRLSEGNFVFGRITQITGGSPEDYQIDLDFGLASGVIPPEALMRYGKLLDLSEGHPGGADHFVRKVIAELGVGDVVFVEIRSYDPVSHRAVAELYRYPQISGGMLALDRGEVRAVISGFHTLGFHRAVQARRQPGSVFKIPTLLAALQLRWNVLDPLHNRRQVFSYQGHHYYPRPDHRIRFSRPSLIWSGMMSENLSFIYLAFHLLDHLREFDFKAFLASMDLAPRPNEPPSRYHYRLSRAIGVQLDRAGIEKYQLQRVLGELEPDLIFRRNEDMLSALQTLWWGEGYEAQLQSLYRTDPDLYSSREVETRIALVRHNFLRYRRLRADYERDWGEMYVALQKLSPREVLVHSDYQEILQRFAIRSADDLDSSKNSQDDALVYSHIFAQELYNPEDDELYLEEYVEARKLRERRDRRALGLDFLEDEDDLNDELTTGGEDDDASASGSDLLQMEDLDPDERPIWPVTELQQWAHHKSGTLRPLGERDLAKIWLQRSQDRYLSENVLLDGRWPVHQLDYLERNIPEKVAQITARHDDDPYALKQYFHHHDFRVGLGLYYLARLCRLLGIESPVEPVLSMPLGTNEVSVAEVAKMFQTFASGKVYRFFDEGPANQLSYIQRIVDREGRTVYEPQVRELTVIPAKILYQLQLVLRKIVSHGTGRRAHGELYFDFSRSGSSSDDGGVAGGSVGGVGAVTAEKDKIRIPAYGKTGSTNDFFTSYFAGFVPYPHQAHQMLNLEHLYTLAAYVGYDIPRSMKKGRISIYGGTGALPLWTDFFKETIKVKDYSSYLDVYDIDILAKNEWSSEPDQRFWSPLMIDLPRGIVLGHRSERYVEDYKPTNFSLTGEMFQDEHRVLSRTIKGHIWAPEPVDMKNPLPRSFSPLTPKMYSQLLEESMSRHSSPESSQRTLAGAQDKKQAGDKQPRDGVTEGNNSAVSGAAAGVPGQDRRLDRPSEKKPPVLAPAPLVPVP